MKIGLQFPSGTIGTDPGAIREYAQEAESLGYNHLVFNEHVVYVKPGSDGHSHQAQYHELFGLLGFISGVTSRIGLLTAVIVLPQRQAAVIAKQATEIDVLSQGRLRLGVSIGGGREEYQANGMSFGNRARRIEEQIAYMRALWTEDWVTFHGEWHQAEEIGLTFPPTQRSIPLWMGGGADAVVDRAGRLADGWLAPSPKDAARKIEVMRAAATSAGRDPSAIGIEGRVEIEGKTPDECAAGLAEWEALGATFVNVRGLRGGGVPIEVARRFKDAVAL